MQTLNAWGQILQQESHAPNVLPAQFQTFATNAAAPVLAALTSVSCTPSIDATTQYYGAASLKVVVSATGATLSFTGTPITIAAASRWFAAFSILAPSGCTGSLTVKTANTTLTEDFTVPSATGWQQVWGLFDLRADASTQATWELTFTSTATVWLDGLQMNLVGSPISKLPKFAGTQMVTGGLAYADSVDLATNQVTNKTADNISYTSGSTVEALQPAEASADVTATHTAADTTNVNGVASASISPIATLMPAEANADVTSSHTSADTSAVNGVPAATVSQGAGRANAAIDSGNVVVAGGIDLSRAYTNKTLTNIPDGSARFAVANGAGLGGVSYWDSNFNPRIDFTGSYHIGKNADNIPAGSTYAIPRGALYNSGIARFFPTGKNLLPNPGFELNSAGVSSVPVNAAAGTLVIDGWEVSSLNGGFSAQQSSYHTHSGAYALAELNSLTTFAASTTYTARCVTSNIPVRAGDVLFLGGWLFQDSNTSVPAGVQVLSRMGVSFYDGSNNLIAEDYPPDAVNVAPGWIEVSPYTVTVPSNAVFAQFECTTFIVNTNTSATTVSGVIGNTYFDDVFCYVQINYDQEVFEPGTYLRFKGAFMDSARRVSTVAGGVSPLGSIATGASTLVASYTSTDAAITINWAAGDINRMDGTQTAVAPPSTTVTGLSASTTYYAASYYDETAGAVAYVTGETGAVGTPAMLYPSESAAVAWQANLQGRVNLGWIPVSTAASGGTGGGNGTSGCCLRGRQIIELQSGVMRAAEELTTGDVLSCPDGATRITQLRIEPWDEWYTVGFNDGRVLEVAPDHRFVSPDGVQIHTRDLKLNDIVQARDCYLSVTRLELTTERDLKVGIEVQAPHTYYVDGVLAHNKVYC